MSNATTMPMITLPVELLRDRRATAELIGALAIGMAHDGDPRPLPTLLQDEARFGLEKSRRVTQQLIALGVVTRKQLRAADGKGWGPMAYSFVVNAQDRR
jgi:hypothetical protein